MKVLFITSWYPLKSNPVAGIFIKEHAKAVSLYNEVVVVFNEGFDYSVKKVFTISDNKEDGIRTIRIKHRLPHIPKTGYISYMIGILLASRRLLKEWWPDIIHAHIYSAGVPAVILSVIYKIPVIVSEHWTGYGRGMLALSGRIKARFALNRANAVITVSQDLQKTLEQYGIKNKFYIVPNIVNTEIFYPSLQQIKNAKKRMLLVALLTPVKGISYLLKALAQLNQKRQDFVLDIVGDGSHRKEYEELVEKLGLVKMVRFHGMKPKGEVAKFMRECDFFVQSSLYETFGIVYIEAMASGKPIVATNLPVLQEIIDRDRGILVPPENVDALADAIDYTLDRYQDYSPEKISQYAKENFSYEVVSRQIDNIYREVIKKS